MGKEQGFNRDVIMKKKKKGSFKPVGGQKR